VKFKKLDSTNIYTYHSRKVFTDCGRKFEMAIEKKLKVRSMSKDGSLNKKNLYKKAHGERSALR